MTSGTRDVTLTVTDDEGTHGLGRHPGLGGAHQRPPDGVVHDELHLPGLQLRRGRVGDSDGNVTSYAWDFGDGETDTTTASAPTHTYAAAGPYVVTLTVTDNDSGTGQHDAQHLAGRGPPDRAGGQQRQPGQRVHAEHHRARGDGGRRPADRWCSASTTPRAPSGPDHRRHRVDPGRHGDLRARCRPSSTRRSPRPPTAGKTVRFSMDAAAKYTLTVAAYTGDMLAPQFAKASETVVRAGHTTPTIEAGAGDWAVSYWADKSSATTVFTAAGRGHPAAGDLRHQRRSHLQRAGRLQRRRGRRHVRRPDRHRGRGLGERDDVDDPAPPGDLRP